MARPDFLAFAGTLVHELRTPLSVASCEVDLALARDRSPAAYREALVRIGERVAELVDLTADFALLGEARNLVGPIGDSVTVQALLGPLIDRFGQRRGSPVAFDVEQPYLRVVGDDVLLAGAVALVVEHAVRHRRDGASVRLRARPLPFGSHVGLTLDALPAGFSAATWHSLVERQRTDPLAHGQLRLDAAARILHACGGTVEIGMDDGQECVRIELAVAAFGAAQVGEGQ